MIKIQRVLWPLDEVCYCGGQMLLAEYEIECCKIETGEDGKQRIVSTGTEITTGTICSRCITQGSTGKPASCF